jgi:triosephosphate isomerase
MKKILIANWKENPSSEKKASVLFHGIAKAAGKIKRSNAEVVICPPFIYLESIAIAFRKMPASAKKNLALGAQDVFWEEKGAFTGQVGPKMLKSLGVRYVIVGHSERRKYAKETDTTINKKIKLALKDKLNVILCVGEPPAVRKKGMRAAEAFIKNQLKKDLAGIRGKVIVAYEPIWAIGSGKNDNPEDAAHIARFIRKATAAMGGHGGRNRNVVAGVLYGGSVNSGNVGDYVQYKEISGALVGGASLKAREFAKMIAAIRGH